MVIRFECLSNDDGVVQLVPVLDADEYSTGDVTPSPVLEGSLSLRLTPDAAKQFVVGTPYIIDIKPGDQTVKVDTLTVQGE